MSVYPISNFKVVQIAPKPETNPGVLTAAEVRDLIGSQAIMDPTTVDEALQEIQRQLQLAVDRGQNNDRIGLENFDIAAYVNDVDPRGNPVPTGPLLIFRSKLNGKYQEGVGAYPPAGVSLTGGYHYATAQILISLAKS